MSKLLRFSLAALTTVDDGGQSKKTDGAELESTAYSRKHTCTASDRSTSSPL